MSTTLPADLSAFVRFPGSDGSRSTIVPAPLIAAYLGTHYCVDALAPNPLGEAFVLRIGERSLALGHIYKQLGVDCAAFLTACNPYSQRLTDAENRARQAQLYQSLGALAARSCGGEGKDPSGKWAAEASLLVPGLGLAQARSVGTAMAQNAIVWCGADAVPILVLLR